MKISANRIPEKKKMTRRFFASDDKSSATTATGRADFTTAIQVPNPGFAATLW
jgi:hypothetical protein